jgi:SAM-dependent methyltransferase
MEEQRCRLARYLIGRGLEVGAGHQPFPVPQGADVIYVDRWNPEENRALFPELGDASFPKPDVVSNFDVDRLGAFGNESQDFVVASHVLEHLADPLGFLDEIHRVLRPGGTLLLLMPDRRRTFDRSRSPTPLQHLLDEHLRGVTDVSDDHLEDFLDATEPGWRSPADASPTDSRAELLEYHRRRSIHVHCWTEMEFRDVLVHAVGHMGHSWDVIDALFVDDEGPEGFEFGFALRRDTIVVKPQVRAARLRSTIDQLHVEHDTSTQLATRLHTAEAEAAEARARVIELQAHVEHWQHRTRFLRRAPLSWLVSVYRAATVRESSEQAGPP